LIASTELKPGERRDSAKKVVDLAIIEQQMEQPDQMLKRTTYKREVVNPPSFNFPHSYSSIRVRVQRQIEADER